jgi:hypothetical protein
MIVNLQPYEGLYPDFIGRRQAFVGVATGPTSYSQTTGDPVSLSNTRLYLDAPTGTDLSVSGNYSLSYQPLTTGPRNKWIARWYVASTGAQVANGVNLSAETTVVAGFCGQF